MTDPIALPPPAFRLIWRDGQYRVSAPNIGDIDCYTAGLARTHADNCIRALKAERDAALARAEKAEARAGSVPAGFVLVPREPTQEMCQQGQWKAREWPIFPLRISPIYQAMLAAAAPSVPSTPPDEATSRAQFEAHIRATWKVPGSYLDWALKRDDRGNYQDGRAADQWSGWQAARTQGNAA